MSRGHCVHLTSDLSAASGGVAFLLGKGEPLQVPHWVTFQWMLFPPWTIHITLFFWGRFPRMWATVVSGVLPNTHGTWPWGNDTVSSFSAGQEKDGEGLDLGERSAFTSPAEKHLIVIPHPSYFHDSFYAVAFTNRIRAISLKYFYIKYRNYLDDSSTDTKYWKSCWRNDKLWSEKELCSV